MYVLDLMVEQIFISSFVVFSCLFFGQHSAFMQTHLSYMLHKDSKEERKD
jgi:hypothetical protein